MAVLADMNAKTVQRIDGIPLSEGHSIFIETYGNQVVFVLYGDPQAGFLTSNPSTGEVGDGPVYATTGNPVYMYWCE